MLKIQVQKIEQTNEKSQSASRGNLVKREGGGDEQQGGPSIYFFESHSIV